MDLAKYTDLIEGRRTIKEFSRDEMIEIIALMEEMEKREDHSGHHKMYVPGTMYGIDMLPKHREFFKATKMYKEILLLGGNRCLLEGTLVATPKGPVAIESLVAGDTVFDCYGNPTKVTATWDNGTADVVKMTNRGKEWLVCTPNHELDCQESRRTKRRLRLRADSIINETQVRRVRVKSNLGDVSYPYAYSLGALLGDGCGTEGTSRKLVISSIDDQIPSRVAKELSCEFSKQPSANYSWNLSTGPFDLYSKWAENRKAHEKLIDLDEIKKWNRVSLLNFVAGLIDTDGSLSEGRDGLTLALTSQSLSIIEGFKYAMLALWQEPVSVSKDTRDKYVNGPCYSAVVRNPHSIKYICEELIDYVTLRRKATVREDFTIGKRSYLDKVALLISETSRGRVYDITVEHPEHFFLLANGLSVSNSGKTMAGAEIVAVLTTGQYPDWWEGVYYDCPISAWAVGQTGQTTRDIIQKTLLGPIGQWGTGLIPKNCIGKTVALQGTPNAVDSVQILHTSGKWSDLGFKSYKQDVMSFVGTKKELVWLDEPSPADIDNECLIRTTITQNPKEGPTGGRMIRTLTPKLGLTRALADFLSDCELLAGTESLPGLDVAKALIDKERITAEDSPIASAKKKHHRAAISIGWEDVPWLDEETKRTTLESTPPHLRDAVSKGIPSIGMGAVYPIPLEQVLLKPSDVPVIMPHWHRSYGLDVGSRVTAAIFIAHDRDNDIVYVTGEHYVRDQPKEVHAARINDYAKGWMPGFIDPASNQTSQTDGKNLMMEYRRLGLKVQNADNAKNEGIQRVWSRLSQGKLKFFPNTPNLQNEYLLYRYDENESNPKPVKNADHALDALRYAIMALKGAEIRPLHNEVIIRPHIGGPSKKRRYNV